MDKAYFDLDALYRLNINKVYFVTRPKDTMKYELIERNYNINDFVGIVGDDVISLTGYQSNKKYPENLRLIKFYDREKDEVISFITNNFDLGSLDIANIYRNLRLPDTRLDKSCFEEPAFNHANLYYRGEINRIESQSSRTSSCSTSHRKTK